MKANLKDILEAIPDFEDFMKLAGEIRELSFKKMKLESTLKAGEAITFREAMSKPLENGKLPSSSFVINAYLHMGINGELVGDRELLASVSSELEHKKIQLSIYRDMLELYRTFSANERVANNGF
jgi:hypothetical protein